MSHRIHRHLATAITVVMVASLGVATTAATAKPKHDQSGPVMYSSIPDDLPGNVASVGFEATSASELGDAVGVVVGTGGMVRKVTVVMSSWGCESGAWYSADCVTAPGATFDHSLTLRLYADGAPTPGAVLGSVTTTFSIPYRPTSDPDCTSGRWQDEDGSCFNGAATEVTFEFPSPGVVVPATVVWGVSYNTTHYGAAPIGESAACYTESGGCGYDSLNVGTETLALVGTDVDPAGIYWNTSNAGFYCDGGVSGVGIFRLDTDPGACGWTDYRPMAELVGPTGDDCKHQGWKAFTTPSFKNQGQCEKFYKKFEHKGHKS